MPSTLEKTQADFLRRHRLEREWVAIHFYQLYVCIENKVPISKKEGNLITLGYQFYEDKDSQSIFDLLFSEYPWIKKEVYLAMDRVVTEALALMSGQWHQLGEAKVKAYYLMGEYFRISTRIIKKEFPSAATL